MRTMLSDVCAENFSEEVFFLPQKIPLLVFVFSSPSIVMLKWGSHSAKFQTPQH